MITTLIAKIAGATPVENFTSRDGKAISKCTVVVDTIEAYPQRLALTAFGDLLPWAQQEGRTVEVAVAMSSHEHDSRWYSELRAVNIRFANLPQEADAGRFS